MPVMTEDSGMGRCEVGSGRTVFPVPVIRVMAVRGRVAVVLGR